MSEHHNHDTDSKKYGCRGHCTKITNLGVRLGGTTILERVNLHIHCGELTCLVGPNGAGKTTLFRALLKEIPFTGSLQFVDLEKNIALHPRIGHVPQKFEMDRTLPLSVIDLFGAALKRRPVFLGHSANFRIEVGRILEIVKAGHLVDRMLGALSGGELQRVLLALALAPMPDILLLDEPISGMDSAGKKLFYKIVAELRRQYDISIIMVSHDIDAIIEHADRIIFLNKTVIKDVSPVGNLPASEIREWMEGP